jgi:hypothetical protein
MTARVLPTPAAPWPYKWTASYTLEGVNYQLQFNWNDRDGFWYLSVGAPDLSTQAQGIALRLGTDKLEHFKYADVPPGRLDVVDTSGRFVEPTRADMGARVLLYYTDYVAPEFEDRQLFPVRSSPPS